MQKLRSKEVPSVKLIWGKRGENEATWELEQAMKEKYLELFGKMINDYINFTQVVDN